MLLKEHRLYCKTITPQRTIFPSDEESMLKFTNIERQLKCPFTVYGDMESVLKETNDVDVKQGVTGEEGKKKNLPIKNMYQYHIAIKLSPSIPISNTSKKLYKRSKMQWNIF